MGTTEDQAKARALREFDRALSRVQVPRFGLNTSTTIGIELPSLDGLSRDFDRELLNRANIQFSNNRDISLKVERTHGGVRVKFIKKF